MKKFVRWNYYLEEENVVRKILKNYNKSKRLSGVSEGKIGTILGLKDKNNKYLVVGGIQYNMEFIMEFFYMNPSVKYMVLH